MSVLNIVLVLQKIDKGVCCRVEPEETALAFLNFPCRATIYLKYAEAGHGTRGCNQSNPSSENILSKSTYLYRK